MFWFSYDTIKSTCSIELDLFLCLFLLGNPREPGTLHYLDPEGGKNDYEKAISAIGGTLANYDSDRKFPVWGFGAKFNGQIYHLFQCGKDSEASGISGVLDAYHQTFSSGLVMSGPTDITEVISTAAAFAKSAHESAMNSGRQKYTILLILTDGSVSDVDATAEALALISNSPLSIVIVGIGNADFSDMQFLDDESNSQFDIVQFVEFNKHKESHPSSLTRTTLAEIPNQLVSFFKRNDIMPLPHVQVSEEEIIVEPEEEEIDINVDMGNDEEIVVSGGIYVPPRAY